MNLHIPLFSLALAAAAAGQTTIAPTNLGPLANGGVVAVITPTGKFAFARIDATLELVAANDGSLTLRAVPSAMPPVIQERLIVFKPAAPAPTTITLPSAPLGQSLMIARNGQILSPTEDYTIAGLVVSFVAQHRPAVGDIYQIRYRE